MASSNERDKDDGGDVSPPLQIIYSCGICQATPAEVYASTESNQGFHSGSGDEDGVVTKMWIGDCAHVMCSRHLEGGAVPFHPKDSQPKASCPQCIEKGDNTPRDLYGIRGLREGEYDAVIPRSWMQCPPISLDGAVPGMESVRFQYMSLIRYAQCVTKYWKQACQKQRAAESLYDNERKQRRQIQAELLELKPVVEDCKKKDARLQKWEQRKPAINHYLAIVNDMAKEIETMRSQLLQLGYDPPDRKYSLDTNFIPPTPKPKIHDAGHIAHESSKWHSSDPTLVDRENSSTSRKRKLADFSPGINGHGAAVGVQQRASSRDLMPPPLPKPKSRFCDEGNATSQPSRQFASIRQPVKIYEDQAQQTVRSASTEHHQERVLGEEPATNSFRAPQALPFRPSLAHGGNRNFDDPEDVYPLDSQFQTPSQPDDEPSRRKHHTENLISRRSDRSPLQREPRRVVDYDSDYGTVAQQYESQFRPPLQPISAPSMNRGKDATYMASHSSRDRLITPSPQGRTLRPGPSVSSPFFRRNDTSLRENSQRSPSRAAHIQPRYSGTFGRDTHQSRLAPSRQEQPVYHHQPSLNGLSFIDRPHRATDHQPLYQQSATRPQSSSRRLYSSVRQDPRDTQGSLSRPNVASLSRGRETTGHPQPNAYCGRMSLARKQHTASLTHDQESALSHIPGVRGVSSQAMRSQDWLSRSQHEKPRSFLSSASGRRSVHY